MPRLIGTTALLVALTVALPEMSYAEVPVRELCEGGATRDSVTGECPPPPPPPDPTPGPTLPPKPTCTWVAASLADVRRITGVDPNSQIGDGYFYTSSADGAIRRAPDGTVDRAVKATDCQPGAGNNNGDIEWRSDGVSVDDLIRLTGDETARLVPLPKLDINPSIEAGGIVNLGMWLAIANPAPVSVTAGDPATGPFATTTATLTTSSWDMGNGDTVECDGPGVPIVRDSDDWNSPDEGPCGYTYTWHTPDDETYTITVTTTWTVTWIASGNRSGTAPTITRTAEFAYDVDEIQTVGAGG